MKGWIVFLFLIIVVSFKADADEAKAADEAKIDAVVNACRDKPKRDKICDALIEFKQVGDDAIELVKNYIQLTPRDYALLTIANILIQGRLRFKTRSNIIPDATDIYDIRTDQFFFSIEKSF